MPCSESTFTRTSIKKQRPGRRGRAFELLYSGYGRFSGVGEHCRLSIRRPWGSLKRVVCVVGWMPLDESHWSLCDQVCPSVTRFWSAHQFGTRTGDSSSTSATWAPADPALLRTTPAGHQKTHGVTHHQDRRFGSHRQRIRRFGVHRSRSGVGTCSFRREGSAPSKSAASDRNVPRQHEMYGPSTSCQPWTEAGHRVENHVLDRCATGEQASSVCSCECVSAIRRRQV